MGSHCIAMKFVFHLTSFHTSVVTSLLVHFNGKNCTKWAGMPSLKICRVLKDIHEIRLLCVISGTVLIRSWSRSATIFGGFKHANFENGKRRVCMRHFLYIRYPYLVIQYHHRFLLISRLSEPNTIIKPN